MPPSTGIGGQLGGQGAGLVGGGAVGGGVPLAAEYASREPKHNDMIRKNKKYFDFLMIPGLLKPSFKPETVIKLINNF